MRRLASVLALLLALSAVARAADPAPASLASLAFTQHPGAPLPFDAPLVDEAGRATTLRAASAGLPLVLVPGYFRCPNLCGSVRDDVLSALARSGLVAGRDYALAAITIDPAETPATAAAVRRDDLARYPLPGGDADVHYLTGLAPSLGAIAAAEGFPVRWDAQLAQFMHPAGLVFATPGGSVSGYLLGVGYAPGALADSVAKARQGVSWLAQPVLLLCFHLDPQTGRYTASVVKLLRVGAALTVLVLGGTLWLAHRPRRKPAP
jgi:protein SCO1/2